MCKWRHMSRYMYWHLIYFRCGFPLCFYGTPLLMHFSWLIGELQVRCWRPSARRRWARRWSLRWPPGTSSSLASPTATAATARSCLAAKRCPCCSTTPSRSCFLTWLSRRLWTTAVSSARSPDLLTPATREIVTIFIVMLATPEKETSYSLDERFSSWSGWQAIKKMEEDSLLLSDVIPNFSFPKLSTTIIPLYQKRSVRWTIELMDIYCDL